jgi:hypothetical protein
MNRSSVVLVLAAAAVLSLTGCNTVACGAGTKLVQVKGGQLQCQPVDALPDTIPCDVDAGAQIVGGQCVSFVKCGDNTTFDPATGTCTGSGGGGPTPPACTTPKSGTLCLHGLLHNFVDNMPYTGPDVKVSYYDPLAFLAGSAAIATTTSSNGGYAFLDAAPTNLRFIAITTGDFADESTIVVAATGDQNVSAGQIYRVDAYVVPRSVTDGWKTQTGVDYLTMGAYVARFFGDKLPPVTNLADNETMPVAGVQITDDRNNGVVMPTANAQYFSTGLGTIDPTLKMTSAVGSGILPLPMAKGMPTTPNFSGTGGMVNGKAATFDSQLGGTAPNVIFVSRFHAM